MRGGEREEKERGTKINYSVKFLGPKRKLERENSRFTFSSSL